MKVIVFAGWLKITTHNFTVTPMSCQTPAGWWEFQHLFGGVWTPFRWRVNTFSVAGEHLFGGVLTPFSVAGEHLFGGVWTPFRWPMNTFSVACEHLFGGVWTPFRWRMSTFSVAGEHLFGGVLTPFSVACEHLFGGVWTPFRWPMNTFSVACEHFCGGVWTLFRWRGEKTNWRWPRLFISSRLVSSYSSRNFLTAKNEKIPVDSVRALNKRTSNTSRRDDTGKHFCTCHS